MSSSLFVLMVIAFLATATLAAEQSSKCSFTQKDATFSELYPISEIPDSQPEGFYAKIKVSVTSDYGDIHILLAESNDAQGDNRGYEFVSAPYSGGEIRRKNSVYGKYEVLTKTNTSVEDFAPTTTTFEVSVSKDGVVTVSVLSPNANIATYDDKFLLADIEKYRVSSSEYSLQAKDSDPFQVKFIAFSGHSKLQFNCDYGVFVDKAHFVQTRCEGIYGWRQEELFHPLASVSDFQPDGYYAKVDVSMLSDYGDLHVILSETNEKSGPNPSYEFVIADRFGKISEFRRKNSISEDIDFAARSTFTYNIREKRPSILMQISVSNDGVLSFKDIHKNVTFDFTDTEPVIPVKYITFAGYRKWPATYEIDCLNPKTSCSV